ncbi:hypothetical protein J6590_025089 [Homalodisca vitripennis]|nr:hypothetical protein J6590_025089 [Homalodisca vitripennis]
MKGQYLKRGQQVDLAPQRKVGFEADGYHYKYRLKLASFIIPWQQTVYRRGIQSKVGSVVFGTSFSREKVKQPGATVVVRLIQPRFEELPVIVATDRSTLQLDAANDTGRGT